MREDIIINTNEDELFSLFSSLLYRINLARNKEYPEYINKDNITITDKEIIKAIKWNKEDLKR